MAITDTWLKANHGRPRVKAEEKPDGAGLSVRASPAGKLVFQMRYRWQGKAARFDLGSYPLMSLKQARAEHLSMKAELEQGRDPRDVRRDEQIKRQQRVALAELFYKFYAGYLEPKIKAPRQELRSFEIHVLPKLGELPADEVNSFTWVAHLDTVKRKSPSIASRILQRSRQMYRWGQVRGLVESNPLSDLSARRDLHIEKGSRGRALSEAELQLFFFGLRSCRMDPANKLFVELCLLLGCRNGELRTLDPTRDLHGDLWRVPPEKSKTGREIIRPLIPEVMALIEQARSMSTVPTLLFHSRSGGPIAPSTTLTMPRAVMDAVKKRKGVQMDHWSMHDLRKTARTNFSRFTEFHVAEMMLGHAIPRVYDYHDYLEEQRKVYQAWARYLSLSCSSSQSSTSLTT